MFVHTRTPGGLFGLRKFWGIGVLRCVLVHSRALAWSSCISNKIDLRMLFSIPVSLVALHGVWSGPVGIISAAVAPVVTDSGLTYANYCMNLDLVDLWPSKPRMARYVLTPRPYQQVSHYYSAANQVHVVSDIFISYLLFRDSYLQLMIHQGTGPGCIVLIAYSQKGS